jgi:uracil-DNA glycosylase family 4
MVVDRCCTHGAWDFFIRSRKIGWNSKPIYQTIFSRVASIKTRLFEQGLRLVVETLRGLEEGPDLHVDRRVLQRIEELGKSVRDSDVAREPSIPEASPIDESINTEAAGQTADEPPKQEKRAQTAALAELRTQVLACTKCPHLVAFRHSVVFGVGDPTAELMFVGEAPGADEDMQGEPFVGRAGELLTRIIETMGFQRSGVYIANVLKCRPDIPPGTPGNRQPTPAEMQTCLPYLQQQIELIQPKVIVALGATAMRGLFGKVEPMKAMRGRWHSFGSIPVMATFHPSYLLWNQALSEKRKVWEDMLKVLERLGHPVSERQKNYFLTR